MVLGQRECQEMENWNFVSTSTDEASIRPYLFMVSKMTAGALAYILTRSVAIIVCDL